MKDKAYKVLAQQLGISNKKAKELIDRGLVYVGDRKVQIARGEIDTKTKFRIKQLEKPEVLYEDEKILAINKPAHITSEEIKRDSGYELLHRLDKETSGVLLLVKDKEFRKKAIEEFKNQRVYKEYVAWVEGIVAEPYEVDLPILTIKKNGRAKSRVSRSKGAPAHTSIEPLEIHGKKTKVKAIITTGRTHQIRLHLARTDHPILGDTLYGGRPWKRIMLHAKKIELLGYSFTAPEPKDFVIQ
ncbi:pseudouridine synthase family protein [Nitratiruptor tergarcus]|uniref:RNA pseudouridylate synthase n=1 Tax=Nitratiruptor tergarcus DSM 16512 TaxID=1069081 RepID=A0A1W1WQ18_9BACT|nr:RluA family pseudouridine synthase [Nitratiruptor tergarcus]SMC08312.1 23S rRNA pseudouridine1911/1915/1917 synthase [Nitratiruptor tergarcus DSM 16512]